MRNYNDWSDQEQRCHTIMIKLQIWLEMSLFFTLVNFNTCLIMLNKILMWCTMVVSVEKLDHYTINGKTKLVVQIFIWSKYQNYKWDIFNIDDIIIV